MLECGATNAPAVLLLHGWGASSYGYRRLLPLLSDAHLRGIAPDLRGHGLSDKPVARALYTSDAMAAHVCAVLDHLHVERAIVVGQSLGGALALDLARTARERVRAALLLAPIGLTRIVRIEVGRALGVGAWPPLHVPRVAIELLLRRVYGTRTHWSARDVDEYWAPAQFPGFVPALAALVERFDWSPRVPLQEPPVHALLGERDKLIEARAAQRAFAPFADAPAHILAGVGHLPAEEAPEDVARAILDLARRTT